MFATTGLDSPCFTGLGFLGIDTPSWRVSNALLACAVRLQFRSVQSTIRQSKSVTHNSHNIIHCDHNNNNRHLYSAINPIDAIVHLRFTKNEIKINVRSCKKVKHTWTVQQIGTFIERSDSYILT